MKLCGTFASEVASRVLDRGFEEQRAFADWRTSGDPRRLVDAHRELIEAVFRPLASCLLAADQIANGATDLVDPMRPPMAQGLVDRLPAGLDARLWLLLSNCVRVWARNASGHAGITVSVDGSAQVDDGKGGTESLDAGGLAFDHQMLQSILMGVEAALTLGPLVCQAELAVLPPVYATRASFEVMVRNVLHEAGCGDSSFNWDDTGALLVTVDDVSRAEEIVQRVVATALVIRPEHRPQRIEIIPRPRRGTDL